MTGGNPPFLLYFFLLEKANSHSPACNLGRDLLGNPPFLMHHRQDFYAYCLLSEVSPAQNMLMSPLGHQPCEGPGGRQEPRRRAASRIRVHTAGPRGSWRMESKSVSPLTRNVTHPLVMVTSI